MKPHRWTPLTLKKRSSISLPWSVCSRCGLVLLRNEASRRAAKAACKGLEDE